MEEEEKNILVSQEAPQTYRLAQISKIRKYFEEEIEFRRSIFSKYKKAFNVITGITHGLNAVSAVAGSATVASFAGVITAPAGIGLGAITIATAVLSVGLIHEKKVILKKVGKHEKITTLAISKLNTINDLVNKALEDSTISADEFALILKEKEKYIILKNTVRKKLRETIANDETLKKKLEEGIMVKLEKSIIDIKSQVKPDRPKAVKLLSINE